MRGSLGEVLTKGRNFVVAGHKPLTRIPTRRQTPYLDSSIGKDVSDALNYLMIIVAMGWLLRNFKVGEREKERKRERKREREKERKREREKERE